MDRRVNSRVDQVGHKDSQTELEQAILKISGMSCAACASRIEKSFLVWRYQDRQC